MPIYEYRCLDCHHEFERMQKFSDPPADSCPSCTGTVQKLISRSAFHLKGDGWYVTDYARKSGGNGGSDGKSTSSTEGSATDSTSQSNTSSESASSSESKSTTAKASSSTATPASSTAS
jgi:putative FmdB family regulatory protein